MRRKKPSQKNTVWYNPLKFLDANNHAILVNVRHGGLSSLFRIFTTHRTLFRRVQFPRARHLLQRVRGTGKLESFSVPRLNGGDGGDRDKDVAVKSQGLQIAPFFSPSALRTSGLPLILQRVLYFVNSLPSSSAAAQISDEHVCRHWDHTLSTCVTRQKNCYLGFASPPL